MDKASLRTTYLNTRIAMDAASHALGSARMMALLQDHLRKHQAHPAHPASATFNVGAYWPFRNEPDVLPLLQQLHEQGYVIGLPSVGHPDDAMQFLRWQPGCAMHKDRFGIATPICDEIIMPDCLLIPCVAADRQGYRLGYGAGFYDRTLAQLHHHSPQPIHTVGLVFDDALLDQLPHESHDQPLNALVTQSVLLLLWQTP
ncbi:5-formyltetrahydrofolate cyclo-ligase [Ampullimonas aquatilis]|uniref:5-formyltetrahydrofolate cyclo-ligase n=1 Tax=Ampullimonas aquatilis TaxID=1341549 RepID=UPI003C71C11F